MKYLDKISRYLKADSNQRIIYFIILLFWLFIGIDLVQYKYDSSPFRIDMLYVMIFPSIILFLPILINRKITWISALSFSIFYSIWSTYKVIFDYLRFFESNYIPSFANKMKDYVVSFLLITISFTISFIILKMKPTYKKY